jgi:hypothetical protein
VVGPTGGQSVNLSYKVGGNYFFLYGGGPLAARAMFTFSCMVGPSQRDVYFFLYGGAHWLRGPCLLFLVLCVKFRCGIIFPTWCGPLVARAVFTFSCIVCEVSVRYHFSNVVGPTGCRLHRDV